MEAFTMMLILWAILFFVVALVLGFLAFGGIAIAVSFFTKILFLLSFVCFLISFILVILEKVHSRRKPPVL